MSNVNIESVFSEYALKSIQGIRNSKLRQDSHTIFDYVTKNFATNANVSLNDTTIRILLNNNLIENRPTNKGDSFLIIHLVTFTKLVVRRRQRSRDFKTKK